MDGITYIPKKDLFECGVELPGAQKFFVWDGVPEGLGLREIPLLDCGCSFGVSSKMEGLSYRPSSENIPEKAVEITPQSNTLYQVIYVRVSPSEVSLRTRINCLSSGSYSVVLCSHTVGDTRFATSETIEINLVKGASLDLVLMQNENSLSRRTSDIRIRQEEESSLKLNITTLNAGFVTNRIHALLAGKKSSTSLGGLYLTDREMGVNTDITLVHNAPECTSRQLFKGILSGNSKSGFKGEVVVSPLAQKTEAYQANNNLLASDSARASSDPRLVIYADDVKCSHGSTSGIVGDDQIFYMRSRGIGENEARILQQQAFAQEVLDMISKQELRERLSCLVEKRLRGEDTVCAGCGKGCC